MDKLDDIIIALIAALARPFPSMSSEKSKKFCNSWGRFGIWVTHSHLDSLLIRARYHRYLHTFNYLYGSANKLTSLLLCAIYPHSQQIKAKQLAISIEKLNIFFCLQPNRVFFSALPFMLSNDLLYSQSMWIAMRRKHSSNPITATSSTFSTRLLCKPKRIWSREVS